jgi:hypothetical protein
MNKVMPSTHENIYEVFQLPLLVVAREELHKLQDELNNIDTGNHEYWKFLWGDTKFSTKMYT